MVSPLLDEQQIISLLDCEATPEAVNRLQAGAAQALVDVYDRKVTRENFLEMVGECLSLYGQAAKLWMMHNVKLAHEAHGVTDENLGQAIAGLQRVLSKQTETVADVVKRLSKCPNDGDVIH